MTRLGCKRPRVRTLPITNVFVQPHDPLWMQKTPSSKFANSKLFPTYSLNIVHFWTIDSVIHQMPITITCQKKSIIREYYMTSTFYDSFSDWFKSRPINGRPWNHLDHFLSDSLGGANLLNNSPVIVWIKTGPCFADDAIIPSSAQTDADTTSVEWPTFFSFSTKMRFFISKGLDHIWLQQFLWEGPNMHAMIITIWT